MLAAIAAVAPWPAGAQCRLCATPSTAGVPNATSDDIRLEIETNLDFDRLIVAANGAGDATLRPDGSGLATGSISMGPRARVASVIVHGEPGRLIRIDVPRRMDLFSLDGSRLTFDQVETDAPAVPRLDSAGNLTFHVGGRLRFLGHEDGDFRGDLAVTVEYQ